MSEQSSSDDISARVERLLTAQPSAPPESRRVRRSCLIEERWNEGRRYVGLKVRVDDEFCAAYRRPGQYVTLKVDGWPPRFYVVAARPEPNCWEFLVDRRGEIGPEIARLQEGDDLLVSLPEGMGFDPGEAAGEAAALFCTGSGVATMRPLVEWWLDDEKMRPAAISLYYGEREGGDFAYESLLERWSGEGVQVHRAVETQASEQFPHRYVQHAYRAEPPETNDTDLYAYLSGAPVMIQIVAETLLNEGVPPSRVKVNI